MAYVSNGKRLVIKRKQTREKVCGLCLNANSCNMQNQNKCFGNSQSFPPPPFFNCIFATVYVMQYSSFWNHKAKSYGIKTTSYAHKTTSYAYKTTSYAYKTTSYADKTTSYADKTIQVTSSKLASLTAETNKFQLTNMLFITF